MKNLEIGQTFEVVEVLDNEGFEYLKGRQGIIIGDYFQDFIYDTVGCVMYGNEIKPIGKLTITKIK